LGIGRHSSMTCSNFPKGILEEYLHLGFFRKEDG